MPRETLIPSQFSDFKTHCKMLRKFHYEDKKLSAIHEIEAKSLGFNSFHHLKTHTFNNIPKNIFLVEGTNFFGDSIVRLQKDGSWRNVKDHHLITLSDYVLTDPQEALKYKNFHGEVTIGENIKRFRNPHGVSSMGGDFFDSLTVNFRVFIKPPFPLPRKSQLIKAIRNGSDSKTQSLVLNINGKFELRDPVTNDIINDPTVVIRHGSFGAGNGYVGPDSNIDKFFVEQHYNPSIQCWNTFLTDGLVNHYDDGETQLKPIQSLINQYNEICKNNDNPLNFSTS